MTNFIMNLLESLFTEKQTIMPVKKKILIIVGIFIVVFLCYCIIMTKDDKINTPIIHHQQMHEIERTERLLNLIDEKTRQEVERNEKISVSSDDVLSVLDNLVSKREKHEAK